RGSLAINLETGQWYDHEIGVGGGVLDFITRETGRKGKECFDWLRENGFETEPAGKPNGKQRPASKIVATFDYVDAKGKLLFQGGKKEPKDFYQRKPGANGEWIWKIKGVRQVPYRLPELTEQIAQDRVVFVVEGEKDANNLWAIGVSATTNP